MKLYIIRHGETPWNKLKKLQGQKDIPLNEEGIRLAELTGEGMKEIPLDFVITSPLSRARKTAEIIKGQRDIPVITDERIMEMAFGEWEGGCIENNEVLPEEFVEKLYQDPLSCQRPPKGECFSDVLERTADFYQSLIKNKDYVHANILISTHGASGRCLLANFYEDKKDIWRGGVPKNCSVCVVEVMDGAGTVVEKDKLYY